MSVVPIGCANDTTSMYEDNTPVISGSATTGLGDFPLPPDGVLDFNLLRARDYSGDPDALVDYLVDITVLITAVCPPGQTDSSGVILLIAGDPDANDYDRDIVYQGTERITGDGTYELKLQICGIVRIEKTQGVDIRITREGGNPAVVWTCNGAYKKYKRLE